MAKRSESFSIQPAYTPKWVKSEEWPAHPMLQPGHAVNVEGYFSTVEFEYLYVHVTDGIVTDVIVTGGDGGGVIRAFYPHRVTPVVQGRGRKPKMVAKSVVTPEVEVQPEPEVPPVKRRKKTVAPAKKAAAARKVTKATSKATKVTKKATPATRKAVAKKAS